jgi:hypothetical protein
MSTKGDFMKRKNLMLTVAAAAVLGAFNPAFAGGGAKHGAADEQSMPPRTEQGASSTESRGADASVGAGVGADIGANAGSSGADINAGASQSSGADAQSGGSDVTLGGNVGAEAGASADRATDPDKLTGLDRAHPAN